MPGHFNGNFSFMVFGIQGSLPTADGDFIIHPNQSLAGIAKSRESPWVGDVVVVKMRHDKAGKIVYDDFKSADFCLIRNYFYHQ